MRLLAGKKVKSLASGTLIYLYYYTSTVAAEIQQEPWIDPCFHRFGRHGVRNGSKVSTIH